MRLIIKNKNTKVLATNWALITSQMERLQDSYMLIPTTSMRKLVYFLIAGEDHRYKYHYGVDIIGIIRAIHNHLFKASKEGASTIEQQLVRVLTGDYRYSYRRKLKEAVLAIKLSSHYSKETIAIAYLNVATYGFDYPQLYLLLRNYGIEQNEPISDEICANIIARLKYPEPRILTESYRARVENRAMYILRLYDKYQKKGYLNL